MLETGRHKQGAPAAAWVVLSLALAAGLGTPSLAAVPGDVQELEWQDLMPRDWDPFSGLEALFDAATQSLSDDSAEAVELFDAYRDAVRSAPVVGDLDGRKVRLPGFVVPLDFDGTGTSEFLLVPYFGACIHVPPPPPNQIVYVTTQPGYPLQDVFDAVWVTGVISTQAHLNEVGDAGYTMQAATVEPF